MTPQAPVFPNKPLIVGLSLPVGAALGLLIGLLMEFAGRRVRGPDDLAAVLRGAPVLGVIQGEPPKRKGLKGLIPTLPQLALRPRSARA